MLWIADKVTVPMLFYYVFIPSIVCMVVPVYIASFLKPFKGDLSSVENDESNITRIGTTMLWLGLGGIIFVPVFKVLTGLPPYVGMMLSLAVVATFAELFSGTKFNISTPNEENIMHSQSPVHSALTKIELPSILFFLGILMAVAALESIGYLFEFAQYLETAIPDIRIVAGLLGLGSINLSPQYNFTLAHKGYKSLGKYINSRSRGNQFRLSTNFNSKNNKSKFKFHLTSQNLFNQESGGLTADGII